ncbi:MAG: hypothetical protein NTY38_06970 [Acidobacteria bacterium]|nr:hypothetical protein [Acidobacteriota bacterium]
MGDVRLRFALGLFLVFFLLAAVPGEGQSRRRRTPSTAAGQRSSDTVLPSFSGSVHSFDGKILTLDQGLSNNLDFHCSRKTKYLDGDRKLGASAIKPGMLVTVEGKQAPDASLDAATVRLEREKPKASN